MNRNEKHEKIVAIYEAIMGWKTYLECFDCLAKRGLKYPGTKPGIGGTCAFCKISGDDIGLLIQEKKYGGNCMIGDVLDWSEKNIMELEKYKKYQNIYKKRECFLDIWYERKDKRKPIEEQGSLTIDFIYSLISI